MPDRGERWGYANERYGPHNLTKGLAMVCGSAVYPLGQCVLRCASDVRHSIWRIVARMSRREVTPQNGVFFC